MTMKALPAPKRTFYKLRYPTGNACVMTLEGLLSTLGDELQEPRDFGPEGYEGDGWTVEVVALTDGEYDALPEFDGP